MKKFVIVLVSIFLLTVFGVLVYFGLKHSRGVPVPIEEPEARPVIEVPFIDRTIDLSRGISPEVWDKLPSKEIKLMYQVTVLPWGKSLVSPITVKAFHNNKDIYFYIKWKDDTEDRIVGTNRFSDAAAIMFPLDKKVAKHTIMMGFMGKSNIWQWKASQDYVYWLKHSQQSGAYSDFYYPFEEKEVLSVSKEIPRSAVNDLVAIRVGTITPKEKQIVHSRGVYNAGTWQVVFRRNMKSEEKEFSAMFNVNEKKTVAFAVWNGAAGDRGGRKSISDWVELNIK